MTEKGPPDRGEQLAALFGAQRKTLWGLAYRLTGSAEDAEDVVQEAFLRLLAQPPAAEGDELGRWLARVATNLGIDARFHRVHHSDPAVDVTTTVRQHPGEGVIRYVFLAAFAIPLGVSAGAFAVYRLLVAVSGLLEHANLRVPARLDTLLSLVFTWPNLHKVHHSRDARLTDTNYGNLVSWWDRLLGTFTPARIGARVDYGLDGFDDHEMQNTAGTSRSS